MRPTSLLCVSLFCLLALPGPALAQGTGKSLVLIAEHGETGPALADSDFMLVSELPAEAGYLAFLDDGEIARLRAWGRALTVLDPLDDGAREYLIQFEHADGGHAELGAPADLRLLHSGDAWRLVSVPAGQLALTPSCLPDVVRVFRRNLRFVRSPWTEAAPLRDVDPVITGMVAGVSQAELETQVQALVDFGTRHSQFAGGQQASVWIHDRFVAYGYTDVSYHDYNSWNDNVVCVKPGSVYTDRYVVIGGHYDSTNFSGDSYAPGADDNATGTVGVLQAAKAFANADFEYTVIFIAFSGEEQGLVGSDAWSADAAAAGMDILGMVNLDMLCYLAGGDTADIDIISNASSQGLRDLAFEAIAAYVPGHSVVDGYLSGGSSDHAAFWSNGFRAIFFFEDSGSYSPYIHTSNDVVGTSANAFPFMVNNVKAAIATLGVLARPFHIAIQHEALGHSEGTGPFDVTATILSADALDPGSLALHYRVNGGPLNTLALAATGQPDEYGAQIPAQIPGTHVEYYLAAADQGGFAAVHPEGAPAVLHGFHTGVTPVLRDDVEADLGWTLGAPGDDAETGHWIRADPVGTSYQSEYDHTPDPGSICFVTGNANPGDPAGTNDVDNGRTTLLSPIFDLAEATWASISYWRWYTDETNHDDDFFVEISNDGGGSWVELETVTDSAYPWVKAEFDDLGARLVLTDQMQLRFIAVDTGSGSLVEALIDDLEIVAVSGGLTAVDPAPPARAALSAFPNPFNPKVSLTMALPRAGRALLRVFDARGAEVARLHDGPAAAGSHELAWNAAALPSGIYLARLTLDGVPAATEKLTLLK